GIFTTAEKQKKLRPEDAGVARDLMCQLNRVGARFAQLDAVQAMTDVTGFGLLGHLAEMAEGSSVLARVNESAVPRLPGVEHYLAAGCIAGGTARNFASYGHKSSDMREHWRSLLCDPQTSGGLLVAVDPANEQAFLEVAQE